MIWVILFISSLIFQIDAMGVYVGGSNTEANTSNKTFTIVEDVDQNKCLCDSLYNVCDLNCCCDPLCSQDLKTVWENESSCLDNEIINKLDEFKCEGFEEYTSRLINKVYEVDYNSYRSIFCVRFDNRPKVYDIFTNIETLTATERGRLIDGSENLGVSYYQTITQNSGETLGNFYVADNLISFKGGFVLRASTSSICQENQEIYFLKDENFNCIHESNTGGACVLSNEIDPSKIADNFILQKSKSDATDVIISSISFVQKNSVTNQYESVTTLPGTLTSLSGTTCTYNAVIRNIDYIIQITNSDITDIQAVVELDTITAEINTQIKYQIETSIRFQSSTIVTSELGQGYSGSPGYIIGNPVIAAQNSSGTFSRFFKDEIPFKGIDESGYCSTGSRVEHNQILFGVNQTISCMIPNTIYDSLTLDSTTCSAIKDSLKNLPFSSTLSFDSAFGIFGNPHVSLNDDWISTKNQINFDEISAQYIDNYCQTMTSIQFMIYYSYVVSEEAKQYYILRISQQPIYKNFTRREELVYSYDIKFELVEPEIVREKTKSLYDKLVDLLVKDISPSLFFSSQSSTSTGSEIWNFGLIFLILVGATFSLQI